MAQKTITYLSDKLNTKISLKQIHLSLINSITINDLYIEDQKGDTLMFVGEAKVKITNWFFIKKNPVIYYVGLKNAQVNLYRTSYEDIWNYQFLTDAFSSKEQEKKSDPNDINFSFDLRKIQLENVSFAKKDQWMGTDMVGSTDALHISFEKINFTEEQIDISSVEGDGITFGLFDYKGGRPDSLRPKPIANSTIDTTPFNKDNWEVTLNKLNIKNSHFILEDPDSKPEPGLFDAAHLNITGINITAKNIHINGDTLTASLQQLQAKDRCGLEIKNMKSDIKVSPNISECKNLWLQTGNSTIKNYYAMRYERFPDFTEYISNVFMEGRLQNSDVSIEDIAFFAPELKKFNNLSLLVSGSAKGSVENLQAKNIQISDGISNIKSDLSIRGLPDIDHTFFNLEHAQINTSGAGIWLYAPELKDYKNLNLTAITSAHIEGGFNGTLKDFHTSGAIQTNLGNMDADMKIILNGTQSSTYSGSLNTTDLNVGLLFNQQDILGQITANAHVKGKGLDIQNGILHIESKVKNILINQYNYTNITVSGDLGTDQFIGQINTQDPNLSFLFDGTIHFDKEKPLFDFHANVDYLDAKAINLTERNITGSGNMHLNFEGTNIDNFNGSAVIYQLNILLDSTRLNLDSLSLTSLNYNEGQKELNLNTNGVQAQVFGNFSILDLPFSIKTFLTYYLPEYVTPPDKYIVDQDISFLINTGHTNDIFRLFNLPITLDSGSTISGDVDLSDQALNIKGFFPTVTFGNVAVNDIVIQSQGDFTGLKIDAYAQGIQSGQSDIVSTLQFSSHIYQDSANFQLLSTTPNELGKALINGVAFAYNDSFYLSIKPSEFYFNDKRWEIPEGNKIVLSEKYLYIQDLELKSGLESIIINNDATPTTYKNILVNIDKVDLSPFDDIAGFKELELDGRISGTVTVKSLLENPEIEFDIYISTITLSDHELGEVKLKGHYNFSQSQLNVHKGSGVFDKNTSTSLEGIIDISNKSENNTTAYIYFNQTNLQWLNPILKGYVHDLSGNLNGEIKISGQSQSFIPKGTVTLSDVTATPDITGVQYQIPKGEIEITESHFEVNNILVKDDIGNEGIISGNIRHDGLKSLNFRLNFNSEQIQVLNLKDYEGVNFYGQVFSKASVRLTGPLNNLNMNVIATPLKNSNLYIPIVYGGDIGEYEYIHFKKYGIDDDTLFTNKGNNNKFNIRIDAIATPDLEATIILDAATGDQIQARGRGNIILELPSDGNMLLNGNYIIEEGRYNFSFRQLQVLNYKREFIIYPNSAIKWNGDVADADLDVAAYTQVKARLYDLIINEYDRIGLSSQEIRDAQLRQMINLQLNMTGSLSKPDLKFKIDLPENRSVGTYAYQKLQRINTDDKELLNQVAGLLLLEQFIPPEGLNSTGSNAAISASAISNMSELLSTVASSQISNFANKVLGIEDLYIGLRYKNYAYSGDPLNPNLYQSRNEAGFNLRKNFFNNRLVVEVGGVYDWGRPSSQDNFTTNFAGDFRVQYLLSEDGRIRFNIFRTGNYDAIFQETIGRQGMGITYRKSFNGINDFFKSQRKMISENKQNDTLSLKGY